MPVTGLLFFRSAHMDGLATFIPDTQNALFLLAGELVNETGRTLFLTGKAGTGKTTFLKYIREHCPKQIAVVAPTGVAAIQAGGVTIHSFFQVPPGVFLPVPQLSGQTDGSQEVHSRQSLLAKLRYNRDKRKLMQQLELLVIDEISMVRADLLDAIDTILRAVRRRQLEPFGGVQLLFIGDLYQLPPVVKDNDWALLSAHYNSPFFFDSQVLLENLPLYIEFDKVYRQRDASFVALLNQVRNNCLDAEGYRLLESRFQPGFSQQEDKGYILLTSHNDQARVINNRNLQELPGALQSYTAVVEGSFPDNAFPAESELLLKIGAQVMFIRNDSTEKGKRFFNGKMGIVQQLEKDRVWVRTEEGTLLEVEREKWKNIRYTVHTETEKLEEEELGSFSQFPLRLAWAITIHKSQGLTFEKAIIDAGEAFAPGQVYVALSRCSSLEGLVLKSRLKPKSLLTDPRVSAFAAHLAGSDRLKQELDSARKHYQEKLLLSLFDLELAKTAVTELRQHVETHSSSFTGSPLVWVREFAEGMNELQETATRYRQWLRARFAESRDWRMQQEIPDRSVSAALFFTEKLQTKSEQLLQCPLKTDSWQHARALNELVADIFSLLHASLHMLQGFRAVPQAVEWHEHKQRFRVPAYTFDSYSLSEDNRFTGAHPILYRKLKAWRDRQCSQSGLPVYMVAGSQVLEDLARMLPRKPEQLLRISGFGKKKLELYGKVLLEIIQEYCMDQGLEPDAVCFPGKDGEKDKKKKNQTSSRGASNRETLRLFRQGKTIPMIASERKLSPVTIHAHLYGFVVEGELQASELVEPGSLPLIESVIRNNHGAGISSIKRQLPDHISYEDIRVVMAGIKRATRASTD